MKLIVDIPEVDYNYIKQQVADGITNPYKIWIANGTPIPDNATPCDFCRYNPPSSTDGKPCRMCPATGRSK